MNPQAQELNSILQSSNSIAYDLLSARGKAIFFPKKGIVGQSAQAKGKRINATIGIGKEEDGSPMRLATIADKISLEPQDVFPYAPSYGKKELRTLWQQQLRDKNASLGDKAISLPVVTNALTHGLSICGYLFVDPQDSVILSQPYWGNYSLVFSAYNAALDTFELFVDGGYNIEGLRQKLMSEGKKKILLLNFPNNPTGYTPTIEEMQKIIQVIHDAAEAGKKICVITDDAYFGLVYKEGIYRESIFAALVNLHSNILVAKVDGVTKEHYAWGLRVGFITYGSKGASKEVYSVLEDKTGGAIRGNISNASHLSQSLVLEALKSPDYAEQKQQKYDLLTNRHTIVVETLKKHPEYEKYFTPLPYNSGYFMCIELKEHNAEQMRQHLLEKYDTGVIAIGNLLRLAYSSLPSALIPELFANIYSACAETENDGQAK